MLGMFVHVYKGDGIAGLYRGVCYTSYEANMAG